MTAQPASPGAAPTRTGSIYDLGYRRYDGVRLGRRHAIWSLYIHSLRGAFGIGRSGRAKIAPFGLAFLALLPALIAVGIAALVNQAGAASAVESPIQYGTYLAFSETLLMLFCAAQGPELVGRDQRYSVLPLYFSRALRRSDYALAKLAALWTALALVFITPEILIFAGRVLAARDVPAALATNLSSIPPIVGITVIVALVLGGISLAIASYTPRRAFATAAIIAAFIVPPIVAGIVADLSGGLVATVAALLDPVDLLDGANSWLFGRSPGSDVLAAGGLPRDSYVPVLLVYGLITVVATIRRYLRIAA
jgi:ABC-2 type transport system permease protein